MFITFEGIDGCGKSTQSRLLVQALQGQGRFVITTREPGGSAGAEEIRKLILTGDTDRWSAETELLLFTAARLDHMEKTLRPALEAGYTVVCDRFADSTRVYQGVVRADLSDTVEMLHQTMIGLDPDLTFIIDMPPHKALARGLARGSGEDRFENFGLTFQTRLREGFLNLAKAGGRFVVIDGDRDPADVAADILHIVKERSHGG